MNTLPADMADIRGRLMNASQRLNSRVDPSWQKYLSLPPEINSPAGQPKPEELEAAVKRYKAVAADAKYKVLTQRPEFQETYGLLKAYRDLQSVSATPSLALPNPPRQTLFRCPVRMVTLKVGGWSACELVTKSSVGFRRRAVSWNFIRAQFLTGAGRSLPYRRTSKATSILTTSKPIKQF